MKLRAIDLGDVSGLRLNAASDVPAFFPDGDLTVVFGIVRDEHLSIGSHLPWEKRLAGWDPRFTYSRCSTRAGMMYCRDVGIFRAWADRSLISPKDLQLALLKAAVSLLRTYVPDSGETRLDDDGLYVLLDGKKFTGVSCNLINERSSAVLCVNKDKVDFDALRPLFFTKSFDMVRDLSEFNIPDSAYREMISWLGRGFSIPVKWSRFTAREKAALRRLEAVHASEDWIQRRIRTDLDCFAFYRRSDSHRRDLAHAPLPPKAPRPAQAPRGAAGEPARGGVRSRPGARTGRRCSTATRRSR